MFAALVWFGYIQVCVIVCVCYCVCVCCRTYRVGVADSGDVLTGSTVLHGQSSFIDHLSCPLQGKRKNNF